MPIPRFIDTFGDYEVVLFCPKCAWSICKDRVTRIWKQCRRCGGKLETRRIDYGHLEYKR